MRAVLSALLPAIAVLISAPAVAQAPNTPAPKSLGAFEKWGAFSYQEQGKPVCYMAAQASEAKGGPPKRGEVFLMVTHRPAQKASDVVSYVAGYELKPGSSVEASVGGQAFKLFVKGDRAWAPDEKTDKALVQAMVKGASLAVKGSPVRGPDSADTVSLSGFGKAYQAISQACGVK